MVDTYTASLEERGIGESKKDKIGILRIEDDKLVFIYDNNESKITEIKFNEIASVEPQRVRFPKGLKEPLITLKDRRAFILCIQPSYMRSGLLEGMHGVRGAVNDNFRALKQGNIQMSKLLNYLIKK